MGSMLAPRRPETLERGRRAAESQAPGGNNLGLVRGQAEEAGTTAGRRVWAADPRRDPLPAPWSGSGQDARHPRGFPAARLSSTPTPIPWPSRHPLSASWRVPAGRGRKLVPGDKAEDNDAGAAGPEVLQEKTTSAQGARRPPPAPPRPGGPGGAARGPASAGPSGSPWISPGSPPASLQRTPRGHKRFPSGKPACAPGHARAPPPPAPPGPALLFFTLQKVGVAVAAVMDTHPPPSAARGSPARAPGVPRRRRPCGPRRPCGVGGGREGRGAAQERDPSGPSEGAGRGQRSTKNGPAPRGYYF